MFKYSELQTVGSEQWAANSSLDQTTSKTLLQRLMKSRPDATIIFISHRPEVAEYCDNVLQLG